MSIVNTCFSDNLNYKVGFPLSIHSDTGNGRWDILLTFLYQYTIGLATLVLISSFHNFCRHHQITQNFDGKLTQCQKDGKTVVIKCHRKTDLVIFTLIWASVYIYVFVKMPYLYHFECVFYEAGAQYK